MFDSISTLAVASNMRELYRLVLVDTPLAPYFAESLTSGCTLFVLVHAKRLRMIERTCLCMGCFNLQHALGLRQVQRIKTCEHLIPDAPSYTCIALKLYRVLIHVTTSVHNVSEQRLTWCKHAQLLASEPTFVCSL